MESLIVLITIWGIFLNFPEVKSMENVKKNHQTNERAGSFVIVPHHYSWTVVWKFIFKRPLRKHVAFWSRNGGAFSEVKFLENERKTTKRMQALLHSWCTRTMRSLSSQNFILKYLTESILSSDHQMGAFLNITEL